MTATENYLLKNPEGWDQEKIEEAMDLSEEVAELEDVSSGYTVPSSSGGDPHTVVMHSVDSNHNVRKSKPKCKHLVAVEYYLQPDVFANSIDNSTPSNPNRYIIGHCNCEDFQFSVSEKVDRSSRGKDDGPEAVPLREIKDTAEVFEDLPEFGIMNYRGKEYIRKEGLIWGFYKEYEKGSIHTEALVQEADRAVVKCTLKNGDGTLATGHGSAVPNKIIGKQVIEMAETRSINRAIRHLFGLPLTGEEIKG